MNRTVLVTGGAHRIGAAICRALASSGWNVCIHCHHSEEAARRLAVELKTMGVRSEIVVCDLRTVPENFIEHAAKTMGSEITGLVNNASVFEYDSGEKLNRDVFDKAIAINLSAPITLLSSLFRQLSSKGSVVNVLDQKILNLNPDFFSYTVSKVSLGALTRFLAQTFAPKLRVNAIAPGLSLPSSDQTDAEFEKCIGVTALGISSTPKDIAESVAYLMNSDLVTGQVIAVDGGQHLIPLERDIMFKAREL